jgi:gliding motility-associated-like protein
VQKNNRITHSLKRLILFVLACGIYFSASAQQQIVFDSAYVVIQNGAELVIDNSSPAAIVNPGAGWIISEAELNEVKWNVGNSTGNYIVPFGFSTTNYIPLNMDITVAGDASGALKFSTYHGPTWDNLTYMPTGVTNMHGNTVTDNSAKAADRFWIIDGSSYTTKPTSDITFTYLPNEITAAGNTITEANLFAQRFNATGNIWADWYGTWGTDNAVLKTVSTGTISPANLLRSWVLADRSAPMGVTPVTAQPVSVSACGVFDTSFTVVDTGVGMTYQWEVNTGSGFANVTNAGVYSGATNATLHITGGSAVMNGYTYYCVLGNGLLNSDTVKITISSGPTVIAVASPSDICKGSSVSLTASGAVSYAWLPSAGLTCSTCSNTTGTPASSVTYSVVGKDAFGCTDTQRVAVKVDTLPIPVVSASQKICEGHLASLNASGGSSYSWSPASSLTGANTSNPIASPVTSTTYTVSVTNGACSVNDSVIVVVNPNPVGVSASGGTTIAIGSSTNLTGTAPAGDNYVWSPSSSLSCNNCPDPVASPTTNTTYTLLVTDNNGCSASDTVEILVNENCGDIFIAGAFSPDGDGHNDFLYVRGNCIKDLQFMVFDRWGNKVFETADKTVGWDGKFNGQPMNVGVYGYYIEAKLIDGTTVQKKGNVGLVR